MRRAIAVGARSLLLSLLVASVAGCGGRPDWLGMPRLSLPSFRSAPPQPAPAPGTAVEVLTAAPEVDFHVEASRFYDRLTGRRFNSLVTYRDPTLRAQFEDDEAFSDYFADLAEALQEARFERNEPLETRVEEFLVDEPGRARVIVRVVGNNSLPFRFWTTQLVREDRWEQRDGRWVIVPGVE